MKQNTLPKTSFTFEETAKELGFASSGALSNHLFRANIHVMRDRLLPTDGKKHRMFSLSLVEKLKAAGHKHKSRMTPKVKKAIREAFLGPKEPVVVENATTPPCGSENAAQAASIEPKSKVLSATQRAILALTASGNSSLAEELMLEGK